MNLRQGPAASHIHPFVQTAALLALDIHNIGVAAASATDTVLLDWIRSRPVVIFLKPLLLILRGLLKVRFTGKLSSRCVGRAVLDRGVPVTEITEVVNVTRGEKGTCGKGMNRGISPLAKLLV